MFLAIWLVDMGIPVSVYALTSGPAQPEAQSFQQAGVSDMVDLQTGDFKYNIPLIDIDGYPLNLSYQAGAGMEDEASWVGLGWTLNTGAINRQVRGVPDDMSGDIVETDHYTKPMITVGGNFSSKTEAFGNALFKVTGSLSVGIYSNNYTGYGAQLNANAGVSPAASIGGLFTGSLGLGITSDSQKGVDASPFASLAIYDNATGKAVEHQGLSASLGYNTRSGMKSLSLGAAFGSKVQFINPGLNHSYNTEPVNPKIQVPYKNTSGSFTVSGGLDDFGIFGGGGITGYKTVREVAKPALFTPTYGLLYAENGKDREDAVMDFIRENENPVIPELPNLAVPIQMPDMFSFTNQVSSGQFRLYRGGSGIFFDNRVDDISDTNTGGLDFGGSFSAIHVGVNYFKQDSRSTTHKWTQNNNYRSKGDFQNNDFINPLKENAHFKVLGEIAPQDAGLTLKMNGTLPVKVKLNEGDYRAESFFSGSNDLGAGLVKTSRQPRATSVSYLTAAEANTNGLETTIKNYKLIDINSTIDIAAKPKLIKAYPRVDPQLSEVGGNVADYPASAESPADADGFPARKGHHISEMTVTDKSGKRMVYGLPVYNVKQNEYSFALDKGYAVTGVNRTSYPGRNKGVDHYYHKETKPPYATSFLLTAVLSPDYTDKTGDGVSDDDQGTAVKFNYSRLSYLYNWRTPFAGANINRGLLADPDDDKGSVILGRKEIWYVSSIESKTKIAYFITEDRQDALGAQADWSVGGKDDNQKLKRLKEIRLYSKADMSRPIKVVKFSYDYTLCANVPNFTGETTSGNGKLTLKKVWFEYQNSPRGLSFPYRFTYNNTKGYQEMAMDRWGMYKEQTENGGGMTNEEYPYANQNSRSTVDENAALWQLTAVSLPTGGQINVNYEADDYMFVQDRKAMAMYSISGLVNSSGALLPDPNADGYLYNAQGIRVSLPASKMPPDGQDITAWFKKNFLNGSDYLYTKMNVDMKTKNDLSVVNSHDFVPAYIQVTNVTKATDGTNGLNIFMARYTENGINTNTIMLAALQRLKNEYPRFAYPGYQQKDKATASSSILSIISAVINAASNFGELFENFYQTANNNHYATKVDLNKSFIRLAKYNGYEISPGQEVIAKTGGGARVKSIYITDNWNPDGSQTDRTAQYGQVFDYTKVENGLLISTGVAAYEPGIGNDENPFKMPVPYIQKIKGGIDNYMDLEEPFGESVFPAPSVTYSRVTVRDLGKNGSASTVKSDYYTVNDFYTGRDYPVKVNALQPERYAPVKGSLFSLIETFSDSELIMSQGYSIELNDMNGKLRSTRIYNNAGAEISATEYFYKSTPTGSGTQKLNNLVKVVKPGGTVVDGVLGQDIELYTDFREQETVNLGTAVNTGAETLNLGIFWAFLVHLPIKRNDDYRLFRSACAFKVVQSYGILEKVVKTQNGSSITTENIAFDGVTGDPLITRTQNEFKRDIFTMRIPAYWAYEGMSAAYQTVGLLFGPLTASASGEIPVNSYAFFKSGDEFIDMQVDETDTPTNMPRFGNHYWVVEQNRSGVIKKYIMNRYGQIQTGFSSKLVKIIRSGARNILDADITQLVSLNNPIAGGALQLVGKNDLTSALKVINASVTTYDETWATEMPDIHAFDANSGDDFSVPAGTVKQEQAGTYPIVYYNNTVNPPFMPLSSSLKAIVDRSNTRSISRSRSSGVNLLGLFSKFWVPHDGTYQIVTSVVGSGFKIRFDDNCSTAAWNYDLMNQGAMQRKYSVSPKYLNKGYHDLRIELPSVGTPHPDEDYAYLEILDNDAATIANNQNGELLVSIFSTQELVGDNPNTIVYLNKSGVSAPFYKSIYNDGFDTPYSPCTVPVTSINPYIYGYAGNWKPYKTKVLQKDRLYKTITDGAPGLVNVKDAGYINGFYSYWFCEQVANNPKWLQNLDLAAERWTTANTVTIYDKYGQQTENVDALNRYSAALFDFNGELPAAVASNARNREIFAASFEDGYFKIGGANYVDASPVIQFQRANITNSNLNALLRQGVSHSGNYSVIVPAGGITLKTVSYADLEQKSFPYFEFNAKNEFIKNPNAKYPIGFQPTPANGGKYLFTAWVKDNDVYNKQATGITLLKNLSNVPLTVRAVVEDWKLVEGVFEITTLYQNDVNIDIQPVGTGPVYIDDIRIHPIASQMKTYAYDDKSMRLMAELDENGFATFYEYDSQGQLARVKKETERGIVTLKESKSSYVKSVAP
ncbi:hypothetical protein [Mucilaginibacter aquariorum]|nr:hypothetical protein [Mucilaginibacter aquariorum]